MVATTTVWGSVAGQIAECAGGSVTTLMPVGADPHDFTPSSDQVATMVDADLVIANGLGLEEGLESAMESAQQDGAVVFEVAPLLDPMPFEAEGEVHAEGEEAHSHGEDPHVWLDVTRAAGAAELIGAEMAKVIGDAAYETCGTEVGQELRSTNDAVVETLAAVPADKRILVTDHDAFGYFTHRYGIETVGTVIPALTTQAQPSAGDLAELEEEIREEKVKAVFPEESVSPALAEAVSRDTGASTEYTLFGDTLGPEGSGAETWVTMMKSNADNLSLGMTGGKKSCFGSNS